MFHSLLVFAAFACLLPYGSPLKCYTCSVNLKLFASCKSPKNLWNVTDCSALGRGFDRCIIHRSPDMKNGVKVMNEVRTCIAAAKCAHYWLDCQAWKKREPLRSECDVGCCKGNLCNKGEPEPPKYKFFQPSGRNLSCYTCSDFPRGTRLPWSSFVPDPRNCTSPVKQKCAHFPLQPYLMQDRCITLKVKARVPRLGNKVLDWTYRGCNSIYHCSFTEALWRDKLNKTSQEDRTGIRYLSGKSSCCHGNLCDSTTDSDNTDDSSVHSAAITNVKHLSTGLAGFLFFVLITMIKGLID